MPRASPSVVVVRGRITPVWIVIQRRKIKENLKKAVLVGSAMVLWLVNALQALRCLHVVRWVLQWYSYAKWIKQQQQPRLKQCNTHTHTHTHKAKISSGGARPTVLDVFKALFGTSLFIRGGKSTAGVGIHWCCSFECFQWVQTCNSAA